MIADSRMEMAARHKRSEQLSERLLEAMTRQRDEARAELERTKAELDDAQTLHASASAEAGDLRAENAKLREAGRQVFGELERVELGIDLQDEDAQNVALAMQAWRAAVGGGEENDA